MVLGIQLLKYVLGLEDVYLGLCRSYFLTYRFYRDIVFFNELYDDVVHLEGRMASLGPVDTDGKEHALRLGKGHTDARHQALGHLHYLRVSGSEGVTVEAVDDNVLMGNEDRLYPSLHD